MTERGARAHVKRTRAWPWTSIVLLASTLTSCANEFLNCEQMSTCASQKSLGGSGGTEGLGGGGDGGAGITCKMPCEPATRYCDEESGECVACGSSRDCRDPNAARCEDGACVPCVEAADCAEIPGATACD